MSANVLEVQYLYSEEDVVTEAEVDWLRTVRELVESEAVAKGLQALALDGVVTVVNPPLDKFHFIIGGKRTTLSQIVMAAR